MSAATDMQALNWQAAKARADGIYWQPFARDTDRLQVPGGHLYRIKTSVDPNSWGTDWKTAVNVVFVPAPAPKPTAAKRSARKTAS